MAPPEEPHPGLDLLTIALLVFFLFLNAEDESLCVLYRRRDGSYGLIEPVTLSSGRSR